MAATTGHSINTGPYVENTEIYPAMTAFTDQYSLPNIFFDIGQLLIEHTNVKRGTSGDIIFKYIHKIISKVLSSSSKRLFTI
jgi:hypothetical protein